MDSSTSPETRQSRASTHIVRTFHRVALPRKGTLVLTVLAALTLVVATVSNIEEYLTGSSALEIPLAGIVAVNLVGTLFRRPAGVFGIAVPIFAFMIVSILSIKHEWSGTPIEDTARALIVVLFSSCSFFIGAALNQRGDARHYKILRLIAFALTICVIAASVGVLRTEKNVMGGTAFELVLFGSIMSFARSQALTPASALVTGVLIVVSSLLVNHRAMIGIGILLAAALLVFSAYRPKWARFAVVAGAVIVAIAAIAALTTFANSEQMRDLNNAVQSDTGRQLMSGREKFWGILVDSIISGPVLGHGPTVVAFDLTGLQLSTHNAFLQVGLNFGPAGLLTVLWLITALGRRAVQAPVTRAGAYLSAALAAIIIHNSSENVLFQNNFPIAAITWINLGFLASACYVIADNDGRKYLLRHRSGIRLSSKRQRRRSRATRNQGEVVGQE